MRARSKPAPPLRRAPRLIAAACAVLALAAPATRGDAGTAAPAVAVATAAELAAAVGGGAVHIIVTNHLDLSGLPLFDSSGMPATEDDLIQTMFVEPADLASIRVCLSST